ncbi:MAG: AAA family ATPase, partial [bacterium]
PSMSVQDHLRLAFHRQPSETLVRALLPQGLFRKEQRKQDIAATNLLETYALTTVANQRADSISFGQQKLLTLACCEASGGSIFLLDEPAAGIHPQYQEAIIKRLDELAKGGRTILLI